MDLEDSGGGMGAETVYGTHEDAHVVMSEKVQSLAGSIYQEFERMIARYDEDVVKTLMPLLVNVLECLDSAYQMNQEHDVELELLREDNEQLVTQYEREKGARKAAEQKLLETEDMAEDERKELLSKQESLENIVRMLELKHKNSLDHSSRLEEREAELKKEYSKLHDRYTELFKTHMEYMERSKMLLASGHQVAGERAEPARNRLNMGRSSGPVSFGFASLECAAEGVDSIPPSPVGSLHSSPSDSDNINVAAVKMVERSQETDVISLEHKGMVTSPGEQANNNLTTAPGRSETRKEQRVGNTLYQELSFQHEETLADNEDNADVTGSWVHPGEYASSVNDNFFGMGKEVENLIMENNELLATKNALNIVKDDLIVKVDELTSELEMLRQQILMLNSSKEKLKNRVVELEDEIKRLKEANDAKNDAQEDESDVPMAQRKRFTRVEMARVLMERNQYKERFMELQEAVRWTEMIRATKNDSSMDKKSKQSMWRKFFNNLFSNSDSPTRPMMSSHLRYNPVTNEVIPGVRALPRGGQQYTETEIGAAGSERFAVRRALERKDQYRQVRAHVRKEDGRLTAYGWSLPGKVAAPGSAARAAAAASGGVPVPVPIYCRPLAETSPGMKIWCGAGVNLTGGQTRDGGLMVGGSVFYSDEPMAPAGAADAGEKPVSAEVEDLEKELDACQSAASLETQLSSYVWISTSWRSASAVTVIDANNPADVLSTFPVASRLLSVASVPGACRADYVEVPAEEVVQPSEPVPPDADGEVPVGRVTYVTVESVAPPEDSAPSAAADQPTAEESEIPAEPSDAETAAADEEQQVSATSPPPAERMSTVLATMWLGAENGMLYVHSSVANWSRCLMAVQLQDAVLSIVYANGRVVVALANGTVAVFRRDADGEWDLGHYHVVQLGVPQIAVKCLVAVGEKVWCGYRNKIHVLRPKHLDVVHTLEAHCRIESRVRQLAWLGEGVWVSIRLDSTLRLYHAHTYQHLQDVDIEPYVSKMLGTGKLGFSLVRITALLISSCRLWIGTSNGVIISVPLTECTNNSSSNNSANTAGMAGGVVSRGALIPGSSLRVTASLTTSPGTCVPYCSMANAQLSFHGHRDSVRFFVAVPGSGGMSAVTTPSEAGLAAAVVPTTPTSSSASAKQLQLPPAMLVMSGGEGYIDFRSGDGDMEDSIIEEKELLDAESQMEQKADRNHLIVWQVSPL